MHSRTVAAALAVLALAFAGACSSDGEGSVPKPSGSSAAASPTVDPAVARKACVDAWAEAIRQDPDSGEADVPVACSQVSDDRSTLYGEAVRQKVQEGRDRMDACLEDPACTEMPIG